MRAFVTGLGGFVGRHLATELAAAGDDVRDTVRGYRLALDRGEPGEVYNICSGKGYAIREVVDLLGALASRRFEVVPDPARMRPSDVERLVGDGTKFHRATGWEPRIPFEHTLKDLLEYWRGRVG